MKINVQEIGRAALAMASGEAPSAPKPMLFGPDGRPVSSADVATAKPKLFDAKNEPVQRKIKAEDIEGFDPEKEQYIYAKTPDGGPASHGNDYKFYTHELEPSKMKDVDPKALFVGRTTPKAPERRPDIAESMKAAAVKYAPGPRNRKERRTAESRSRRGL